MNFSSISPSHGLQFLTNCPSVGPFHGCSPSGTSCSSVGPHGLTSPVSKPAPVWAPLSTGPQVLPGACSSVGSPWGHSLLWASTCPGVGSIPMRCSPSGTGLLQRGSSTGSRVLPENLLQHGLLSLHGSTGPGRSLLQHKLLTGSQLPSGVHLLQCGVFHRLEVGICSTVDLHGLQGASLPHHGLHHGLQGKKSLLQYLEHLLPLLLH